MQDPPKRGHIAEFGIGEDRRDVQPRAARPAEQGERLAPLS